MYKAFISYSHAADGQLAPALQSALHRFARPFYRLRAIRVFRDKTSLHLTPELWPLIQAALAQSEYFILLASPGAARSEWVQMEVAEWLKLKNGSVDHLLIVQTEGEIQWDNAANDFDWSATTALPPNLKGAFKREPFYSDLRWARTSTDVSLRNPQFLDDVGTLASALHGKSKDEMLGDDIRQHRVFKAVALVVGVLLFALAVGATGAAVYANRQRLEAERQTKVAEERRIEAETQSRIASSREIASTAVAQLPVDPELGVMLALEAYRRTPTAQAEDALRRALLASRVRHTIQHISWFDGAQFSSDGRWLAVEKGSSHVLEVGTWKEVATFRDRNARVSASFTADGKTLLTRYAPVTGLTGVDQITRAVESGSWRPGGEWHRKPKGHEETIVSPDGRLLLRQRPNQLEMSPVADPATELWTLDAFIRQSVFSPDGRLLAVVGRDRSEDVAYVLDATTGRKVIATGKGISPAAAPVFNASVTRVAFGALSAARVFDVAGGKEVARLEGHTGTIQALAFSPDGKWLVTAGDDDTARVWDAATWKQAAELSGHTGGISDAVFSADGGVLVTASEDGTARVWDAEQWRNVAVLSGHTASLLGAAVSPDGRYVATHSQDSTLRVWDVGGGGNVVEIKGTPEIGGGAFFPYPFSPDGRLAVTRNRDTRGLDVRDTRTWRRVAALDAFKFLTFSPDSRSLFAIGRDVIIERWDVATWRKTAELEGHTGREILSAAFSPDGKWLVTAGGYDQTARVWNAATGGTAAVLGDHEARVVRAVFSPDGKWIATSSYDNTVRITETGSWKPVTVLRGHEEEVWRSVFSRDGRFVLTSGYDRTARIWDTRSWKTVGTLPGGDALFSADARRIVTTEGDVAGLWDAGTRKLIRKFDDPDVHATFSADGALLAFLAGEEAHVWDAVTGATIAVLRVVAAGTERGDGARELTGAAFSPDGKWLLITANDGISRVFPRERFAPAGELVALAKTRVTRAMTAEEQGKYLHEAAAHR